jgi:hypothetical protein
MAGLCPSTIAAAISGLGAVQEVKMGTYPAATVPSAAKNSFALIAFSESA